MSNAAYPDKQFTDSEKFDICRSYKNAIDQSTMVTTLSELYACSPHSIEAVLVEARQLPQLSKSSEKRISTLSEKRKSKTSIGRRMHWSPDSIAKLQEYCSLNMSISDIADKFDNWGLCRESCIRYCRIIWYLHKRSGLPVHRRLRCVSILPEYF